MTVPTPEERAALFAKAKVNSPGVAVVQAIEGPNYEFGIIDQATILRIMRATRETEDQLIELRRRIKDVEAIVEYGVDHSSVVTLIKELKEVLE